MLSLLFISDNNNVEYVKNVLKPTLKLIVNIAPNFDIGLQEAIEKRPNIICLKDQIKGVSGEEVARHIQMLLGNAIPTFILMHEGSNTPQKIVGLFDYIVDLNQPKDSLAEEITNIIKVIAGDKWGEIFIPASQASLPKALQSVAAMKADKTVTQKRSEPVEAAANKSSTPANTPATKKLDAVTHSESLPTNNKRPVTEKEVELVEFVFNGYESGRSPTAFVDEPVSDDHAAFRIISYKPAKEEQITTNAAIVKESKPTKITSGSSVEENRPTKTADVTFYEENKPSRLHVTPVTTRLITIAAALIIVFTIVVSYLLIRSRNLSVPSVKQANTVTKPIPSPVLTPISSEKKTAQVDINKPSTLPILPAFIPAEGHDKKFSANNPGWERYLGKKIEYRMFRENGRIKAVQIIANKGDALPQSLVKAVLTELTGSADYETTSTENKSGLQLVRGIATQKNDLLFYSKDSKVLALVVTIY